MIAVLCTLMLVGGLTTLAGARSPRPRTLRPRRVGNPAIPVAAALAAGAAALVVTTVPVFAVMAAAFGANVPAMLHRRSAAKRVLTRAQAWPSVLDDVTSAVRAGLNLPEAISHAARHAPADLQPAFAAFDRAYARTGDFAGSLESMRQLLDDRVFDQIVHAMAMAREVGGHDLTQVLRALGGFIRSELQVRGELLARQSWTVNSARMAVAAPWIVLVMLSSRPSTVAAYATADGVLVLVAVAVMSVVAYAAMLRIAKLEASA